MRPLVIAAVFGVAGCQWIPGTDAYWTKVGKNLAASELRDPSSAQFRDLSFRRMRNRYTGQKIIILCGEINGRNAYGIRGVLALRC